MPRQNPELREKDSGNPAPLPSSSSQDNRTSAMSAANPSECEQTEEAIEALLNALSRQHEANKALRAHLNEIESSKGWRTLQYYYKLRNSIFPQLASQKNGADGNAGAPSGATNLKKYIWFCRSIGFKKATIHASRQVFKKKRAQTDGATGLPPGSAGTLRNSSKPVRRVLRGPDRAPHSSEMLLCCEEPQLAQACGRTVAIRGWSTAPSGIARIEVLLDDEPLAIAHHAEFRPDLAAAHTGTENIAHSGFSYDWDSRGVADGAHRLTVVATSQAGAQLRFVVPILLFDSDPDQDLYDRWIQAHEPDARELARFAKTANALRYQPLISIVLSFDGSDAKLLGEAIASIRSQAYAKWEGCLAGFGPADAENRRAVSDLIGADPKIRLVTPPEHAGRAAALNAALAIAKGDFVAFLDGRDTLSPDALYWVVDRLQRQRDADLVYSDEDRSFASGRRHDPFFKPDWSPDLLLSMNFMRHFLVVRRKLIEAANGFRDGFDGAEEYDLTLRLVERTAKIQHISRVLYHQRVINVPGIAAETPDPVAAEQRGLSDCLVRNHVQGQLQPGTAPGIWRVRYEIKEFPKVGVILPTGGRVELLSTCLESLFAKTSYEDYKILVVDNSRGTDVKQYLAGLAGQGVEVDSLDLRELRPFNYSKLNNLAAKEVQPNLCCFFSTTIPR